MATGNFRPVLDLSTWRPDFDGLDIDSAPGETWGTRWGVTEMVWANWQAMHPSAPEFPVATKDDFAQLYQFQYWTQLRCEQLPKGVDLMVFDFGVNCGPGASARQLQTVLHRANVKVAIDGSIGPMTINAAVTQPLGTLIAQLGQQHLRYYQGLAAWPAYGRGWTNRNNTRIRLALTMAGLSGDHQ